MSNLDIYLFEVYGETKSIKWNILATKDINAIMNLRKLLTNPFVLLNKFNMCGDEYE